MQGTRRFEVHPWQIVETEWDRGEEGSTAEAIFSLSNEFMGTRGSFEEGTSATSLRGSYFNAIYEYCPTHYLWPRIGFSPGSNFIANGIQWIGLRPIIDGERLDMASGKISNYRR